MSGWPAIEALVSPQNIDSHVDFYPQFLQMSVLDDLLRHGLPEALADGAYGRAARGRHAVVRMVCAGADIRVEHHLVLRGHLLGLESNAEAAAVLDQFCV